MQQPSPWTTEAPYVYTLVASLVRRQRGKGEKAEDSDKGSGSSSSSGSSSGSERTVTDEPIKETIQSESCRYQTCQLMFSQIPPHIFFYNFLIYKFSRVAFRTLTIRNGVLLINGGRLQVRGVNWHEHDPLTGHYVRPQLLEADIKLMKRNNFNAVRTSHYPQCSLAYELCSLYGIYVVDEANIETHGMTSGEAPYAPYAGRLADDPSWAVAYLLRLQRM